MKLLPLLLLFTLASCGFEVVDTGRRGIKTSYGKVIGEPLPEGVQLYNPFSEDVVEMNIREQAYNYSLEVYSEDNQPIDIKVTVVAFPEPTKVGDIYREYGEEYFTQIADKEIIGGLKDIVGRYTADNIVSQRGKLRADATEYLSAKLLKRNIHVTGVDFTNLKFDEAYEHAVQQKVTATQLAEAEKNRTAQIREQKDQAILTAQGQAEAIKIKAQALSQNAKLVELEAVQKWDGRLPTNMYGGAMPFIRVGASQ